MDSTERFSDRVDNYRRFRPRYPVEILPFLEQHIGLTRSSVIADIGSGTGILTEMLLRHGNTVYAVEPNDPMRCAAESLLHGFPNFRSIKGTAEAPSLPDGSIDVVTAAQAFHWFDMAKAREAFSHLLKPGGWVVLIWNNRNVRGTPFLTAYEEVLRTHGIRYPVVADESLPDRVKALFGARGFTQQQFPNLQALDLDGLIGRLLSSSYMPNAGEAAAKLRQAAEVLFRTHNANGTVTLEYTTQVYAGRMAR